MVRLSLGCHDDASNKDQSAGLQGSSLIAPARARSPLLHMLNSLITIARLKAEDAACARQLLVDGLTERWGTYEARFNPDIDTLPLSYEDSHFLVAKLSGQLVGTGLLKPIDSNRAEICRMSVVESHRRLGIGSNILSHLVDLARELGMREVCLETTSSWESAVKFYVRHGFRTTHEGGGNSYFSYVLRQG
jgi:ribosomal protein S18 acetylase RimI-like enzyme